MNIEKIKNAWKSLTIWFNAIAGGALAAFLNMGDTIRDNIPFAQQYLSADVVKYAAFAVIAINIGLRFKTNKSLADK